MLKKLGSHVDSVQMTIYA